MLASGGGERASAVVLDAREIAIPPGMPSAPAGMVDISLEIRRADGTRYTTVTRVGFSTPERRARVATPGTQLTVLIDPGDRSQIAIAPPACSEAWRRSGGQRGLEAPAVAERGPGPGHCGR